LTVRRVVERRENDAEIHFHPPLKAKASIPTPGTEALKTPWYHPDSARTSPSLSDALHSARHEGKTESITRISRIQARRRVQQDSDWLAPSANSLQKCGMIAVTILFLGVAAYYSSSLPLPLLFDDRLLSFRRGLFTRQFREHNEHAFDRPKQGITGEHDK